MKKETDTRSMMQIINDGDCICRTTSKELGTRPSTKVIVSEKFLALVLTDHAGAEVRLDKALYPLNKLERKHNLLTWGAVERVG